MLNLEGFQGASVLVFAYWAVLCPPQELEPTALQSSSFVTSTTRPRARCGHSAAWCSTCWRGGCRSRTHVMQSPRRSSSPKISAKVSTSSYKNKQTDYKWPLHGVSEKGTELLFCRAVASILSQRLHHKEWRIQVRAVFKTYPKYLISILPHRSCTRKCTRGETYLDFHTELHVHGDDRWPNEVTSYTYFMASICWQKLMIKRADRARGATAPLRISCRVASSRSHGRILVAPFPDGNPLITASVAAHLTYPIIVRRFWSDRESFAS